MKYKIKLVLAWLRGIIMPIQIIGYLVSPIVKDDTIRWKECYSLTCCTFFAYLYLLTYYKEFRNLVYKRTGIKSLITPPSFGPIYNYKKHW